MASLSLPGRLPRLLFRLNLLAAGLLAALVFLSPLLDHDGGQPQGWRRLVAVFARDAFLRRTALASAAGLCATACVFFRSAGPPASLPPPNVPPPNVPPPADVIGA